MKHWAQHPHADEASAAERFVAFLGTKTFLIWQTVIVALWIILNTCVVALAWDPAPYIMLNLVFSTQAAYATPLIIMATTAEGKRNAQQAIAQHELSVKIHDHNVNHVECDCE